MQRRTVLLNLALLVSVAAACAAGWAYFNRPIAAPDWPDHVSGYAFSPPQGRAQPEVLSNEDEIRSDIDLLSEQTDPCAPTRCGHHRRDSAHRARIRHDGHDGCRISLSRAANEFEINRAIEIANGAQNIDLITVGNEALFRGDVSVDS
jgi:exo-beta-1,3-glucanase (GH17 family)